MLTPFLPCLLPPLAIQHSAEYGYEFYLWRLALAGKLSCNDVTELLKFLMGHGMDANAEISFTPFQVRLCLGRSVHTWPTGQSVVLSMLMLALEFVQQLPLASISDDVRAKSQACELFEVLICTENAKVALPNTPIVVSKVGSPVQLYCVQ